jgi:hypothetical protein
MGGGEEWASPAYIKGPKGERGRWRQEVPVHGMRSVESQWGV